VEEILKRKLNVSISLADLFPSFVANLFESQRRGLKASERNDPSSSLAPFRCSVAR